MKWGLIPFWAKDPSISNRMIDARAETLADKPVFRQAFQKRMTLFTPYSAAEMDTYPVSTLVNSPKNDFPEVIAIAVQ